jgi:hypothetical protein
MSAIRSAAIAVVLLASPRFVSAQASTPACEYERCALTIVPRLTALTVARGASEERVTSLAFLFPHGVADAFAGNDAAEHHAQRAFSKRVIAAVLTDAGIAVAAAGLARQGRSRVVTTGIGVAMVASSVPIHFAADAELSRAVWEYNRRFSR